MSKKIVESSQHEINRLRLKLLRREKQIEELQIKLKEEKAKKAEEEARQQRIAAAQEKLKQQQAERNKKGNRQSSTQEGDCPEVGQAHQKTAPVPRPNQ